MGATGNESDGDRLAEMLRGYILTQLIGSAVRLGVFDCLGMEVRTDAQLSAATGVGMPELRRLLRALVGLGLIEPVAVAGYRRTPMARHLDREAGSLYGQALMAAGEYYEAWSDVDFALRSGQSAFEHRHGRTLWSLLGDSGEAAASFTRTMRWNTERALDEILSLYDFPASGVIVDLGAGDGTLSAGLLARFPDLRVIVFEQPSVVEHPRRTLTALGLADRCEFASGSILTAVPQGVDLYILKAVIHNWNDVSAVRILENCRRAMGEGSRLLIIERMLDIDDVLRAAIRDLTMLVLFGSRDRTLAEYGSLVEQAGLTVRRTVVGPSGMGVLEAESAP